jgi:hypothetical protein
MLKRFPVYPFLFVLYIVLTPLFLNLDQIGPLQAVRPLVALLSIALLGFLALTVLLKDRQYAGYLVFLFFVFYFAFGHLIRLVKDWLPGNQEPDPLLLLLVWGIFLVVLGLRVFWQRMGCAGWAAVLFTIILGVAVLIQGFTGLSRILPLRLNLARSSDPAELSTADELIDMDCQHQPDIYLIFLDGYGRADVLEKLYGVSNAPFLDNLERKGFYIAGRSHTNYTQTIYSVPSTLSFNYLTPEPIGVSGSDYFLQLMIDNRIMRLLKACGYKTVAIESGFYFTNHFNTDVRLSSGTALSEFESLLLADTPWIVLMDALNLTTDGNSPQGHRKRVLDAFEHLMDLPKMAGPKFVVAHIVSPHPPFVFGPEGQALDPDKSYSMVDGSDFPGNWETYRAGYAGQVGFINQEVDQTIDAILARSKMPPVIIIQGDHGPGGFLDWGSPGRTCLWERSAILNAYYLPGGDPEDLYETISPVNSFRVVLNTYFGTNLEFLPDETYFTSHELPRQVIDITASRDSAQNCMEP